MGIAFEMALASFRPFPDHADPVREAIARKIIELAKAGGRDPERLCNEALKGWGLRFRAPSPLPPDGCSPLPAIVARIGDPKVACDRPWYHCGADAISRLSGLDPSGDGQQMHRPAREGRQ
jgi:hypothetical protein